VRRPSGEEFNVGTGFSDTEREAIWNHQDMYLNEWCIVIGQEVSTHGAIRFPVFDRWD